MSPRSEYLDALQRFVAAELLDGEEEGLTEATPLLEWGVIDSLSMVSLLTFIDERLGICVPDEEVRPEHFANLGVLADLLLRIGAQSTPRRRVTESAYQDLETYGAVRRSVEIAPGHVVHTLVSEGRGPTWLLIPPPGHPSASWGAFMRPRLGLQSMVAVDLPGFGPSTRSGHDVPELADHLEAVLFVMDQVVEGPVVLVGASTSAILATEIARRRGDRVAGLVAVGFAATSRVEAYWEQQCRLAAEPGRYLQAACRARPDATPALLDAIEDGLQSEAFRSFIDPRRPAPLMEAFDGLLVPTLVVVGEEDAFVSVPLAAASAHRIATGRLERIPRCGHLVHLERPQELLHLIERFLTGNPHA